MGLVFTGPVSLHVDVVRNEWSAGRQTVVARVVLHGGRLSVDSPQPATWSEVVLRPLRDPETRHAISADVEPERFLRALSSQLHGSHLFATEPHEDPGCPFPDWHQTNVEAGVPVPARERPRRRAAVHARGHKRAS